MFARTERLLLRPSWVEDRAALADLFATPALDSVLLPVAEGHPFDIELPWIVIQRRTAGAPELVGCATLGATGNGTAELRIWIAPFARRLGLASEAAPALLDMARFAIGARRIVSRVPRNELAGQRLCERLGMAQIQHGADEEAFLFHCHLGYQDWEGAPLAA